MKQTTSQVILTAILFSVAASSARTTTAAVLTEKGTTVTAFEVPRTTGLAVIDGKTYSFRGPGLTLPNGDVVSLGFNGLEDKTTTDTYQAIVSQEGSASRVTQFSNPLTFKTVSSFIGQPPLPGKSTVETVSSVSSAPSGESTPTSGQTTTVSAATASGSASSGPASDNSGTPQSIGTGKAVALVGALAAVVLCGL